MAAAKKGHAIVVDALLANGAEVDLRSRVRVSSLICLLLACIMSEMNLCFLFSDIFNRDES